ncbi:MAG: cytochrome c biogenesis protein CcsA [Planctomycetaceae bacterium]|nr:cytochrome c biogenesis protein CcsA [Planctomycetaceae bacterium]
MNQSPEGATGFSAAATTFRPFGAGSSNGDYRGLTPPARSCRPFGTKTRGVWPLVAVLAIHTLTAPSVFGQPIFDAPTREFLRQIDASELQLLGVQYQGRIAPLDTVAREQLAQISGSADINALPPAAAYLEIYLNAGAYLDAPLLYVGETGMRDFVARHLQGADLDAFRATHRLAPRAMLNQDVGALLVQSGRATPEQVSALPPRDAPSPLVRALSELVLDQPATRVQISRLTARAEAFIAAGVLRVIPASTREWPDADTLLGAGPGMMGNQPLLSLRDAWRGRNAGGVNTIIHELAVDLPAKSESHPPKALRQLEVAYNRTYKATLVWAGFALATVLFIIAAPSRRRWARRAAMTVLALSTSLLAAGFMLRWMISGRAWYLPPMMTQWEALVASALLGAVFALAVEWIWKRNYIGMAASLYAAAALLAASRMGGELHALQGLLSSKLMAAHVSLIIIGHALAGMTLVISVAYLVALVVARRGKGEPLSAGADLSQLSGASTPAAIDGCNVLTAQLACWTIIAGIVLGAMWGDVAWGRWWGWDAKETWALLTALVYVLALHVRYITPARIRGGVTAWICIVGCAVMLFNWFIVGRYLSGLHGYS